MKENATIEFYNQQNDDVYLKVFDMQEKPCLDRKTSVRTYVKKMDSDAEAHLIAISCNEPPKGFSKWSLRMLADKMVELEYVESLSQFFLKCIFLSVSE